MLRLGGDAALQLQTVQAQSATGSRRHPKPKPCLRPAYLIRTTSSLQTTSCRRLRCAQPQALISKPFKLLAREVTSKQVERRAGPRHHGDRYRSLTQLMNVVAISREPSLYPPCRTYRPRLSSALTKISRLQNATSK